MKWSGLEGIRFGRLTAIRFARRQGKRYFWICVCQCGNEVTVERTGLKSGNTKSCGCFSKEFPSKPRTENTIERVCLECGSVFKFRAWRCVTKKHGRFCSAHCRSKHAGKKSAAIRPKRKPAWRDRTYEYTKNNRARHPEQRTAQVAVYSAIKSGRLVRAQACEKCGSGSRRIEAHHEDYSKPIDVVWLCTLCHRYTHAVKRRAAKALPAPGVQ